MQAENKRLNAYENQLIKNYIAKDSTAVYITSAKGFWYTYNTKKENGVTPVKNDEVVIEYAITDLQGNIIYSKEELGEQKYKVDKEDFIPALQDGIKLVKKGETVTFVINS